MRSNSRGRQLRNEGGLEDPWRQPGMGQFQAVPQMSPGGFTNNFDNMTDNLQAMQAPAAPGNPAGQTVSPAGMGMGDGICLYRCSQCGNTFQGQTNGGGLVGPQCPVCRIPTQRIR